MEANSIQNLKDGDKCKVIGGTHIGKSGIVRDINIKMKAIKNMIFTKCLIFN